MRLLLDYSWPGNVRELANVLEYAVTVAGRETIMPEDLPEELRRPASNFLLIGRPVATRSSLNDAGTEDYQAEDLEAARLRSVLDTHQWKRAEAARALGISRATLWRRMRELHLV